MKIAILYICTGKYNVFFKDFYESCEKFLLKNAEKTYFVFSDDDKLSKYPKVYFVYTECKGFPFDSLFRFEMFLQVKDQLNQFDYVYFMNSNALFLKPVDDEILPDRTGLAMGIHPGKRERQHPMFYPYERNRKSLSYVSGKKSGSFHSN